MKHQFVNVFIIISFYICTFFNAYVSKSGSFQTSSVLESAHICTLPRPHFSERRTHLPPGEEAKAVNW